VHEVDTFTTFAAIAGAAIPTDRPIDAGIGHVGEFGFTGSLDA
jgi:hypothetical protein